MTIWEAILLGVVQGIFMFFPVSSTAHLTLVEHWLIGQGSKMLLPDSPQMILFKLLVHVGTLISILVVFRRSISRFLYRVWRDLQRTIEQRSLGGGRLYLRLALLGLFSVFVTGALGMPLKSTFENFFAHPLWISVTLAITGVLLYFTDTVGPRPRGLRQITLLVALIIGVAQCLALIPGFSRSGLTIAFALFIGLKRRWAAEYSFFIAFPTILGATLIQALAVWRIGGVETDQWLPYAVGFAVSALVGIAALYLVLTLLYQARFRYFSYYVWALALVIAGASLFGTMNGPDPDPAVEPTTPAQQDRPAAQLEPR